MYNTVIPSHKARPTGYNFLMNSTLELFAALQLAGRREVGL